MKKYFLTHIVFTTHILFAFSQSDTSYLSDQIVVEFKSPVSAHTKEGIFHFGISPVDELNQKYKCIDATVLGSRKEKNNPAKYLLKFENAINIPDAVAAYTQTNYFTYAEPNYYGQIQGTSALTPNDPFFNSQWSLRNDGTFSLKHATVGADIKMTEAWDIETGDSIVINATIDTGCKLDHPDLAGRIWHNYNEIPGNGIDDDGNRFIDDYQGWNFVGSSHSDPVDDNGHGTNVTSIIGANGNNALGLAGVDWNCKLMILKALTAQGGGTTTSVAEAINYAVDNGAKVVNMSLGFTNYSRLLENSVENAYQHNVILVVAMGNNNFGSASFYPAAFPHVIAVGATNPDDTRCNPFCVGGGGSNYGSHISVVAPGNYIYGLKYNSNTDFTSYICGTSQATPHVAGLVSLLLSQDTSRTPDQIKAIIDSTADDQVGDPAEDSLGWDQYYGYGRVNAYRALQLGLLILGTKQSGTDFNVDVYPNPASGRLSITVLDQSHSKAEYTLMNISGVAVLKGIFRDKTDELDISGLPGGIYFVRIKTNTGTIVKKAIIE